jgi:hypothetical protein
MQLLKITVRKTTAIAVLIISFSVHDKKSEGRFPAAFFVMY